MGYAARPARQGQSDDQITAPEHGAGQNNYRTAEGLFYCQIRQENRCRWTGQNRPSLQSRTRPAV